MDKFSKKIKIITRLMENILKKSKKAAVKRYSSVKKIKLITISLKRLLVFKSILAHKKIRTIITAQNNNVFIDTPNYIFLKYVIKSLLTVSVSYFSKNLARMSVFIFGISFFLAYLLIAVKKSSSLLHLYTFFKSSTA